MNSISFYSLCVVLATFVIGVIKASPSDGFPGNSSSDIEDHIKAEVDVQLANHVRAIIKHFKQGDPKGLPEGMDYIPDPMPIPDTSKKMQGGLTMTFTNMTVHGLSQFRLDHVRSDLSTLKVSTGVKVDQLKIIGQYALKSWLSSSKGNFYVLISNVSTEAEGDFEVSPAGLLEVQEIGMDVKFQDIKVKFDNLGLFGGIVQGLVNSIGTFLFDSIKPLIFQEVETNLRTTINRFARDVPQRFPNSVNPLDIAILAGRKYIKEQGLDPLDLPDYKEDLWSSTLELTSGVLEGLATVHRTGPIQVGFENNSIHVRVHMGAENLKGTYKWSWGVMRNLLSRKGEIAFTVEYFSIGVKVQQPANLDLMPSIDDIELELGNIAVLSEGAGTVDYIAEAAFNILPNIFRKQIIDAIETPLCRAIEVEIRKLKLEAMIEEQLP